MGKAWAARFVHLLGVSPSLSVKVVSVGEPMSFIKGSLLVQSKLRPVSLISQVNHT